MNLSLFFLTIDLILVHKRVESISVENVFIHFQINFGNKKKTCLK